MATTATFTLDASEFTGGSAFSVSTDFLKAGTSDDLTQFTGLSRKEVSAATDDISVIAASDYSGTGGKLYFKNCSTTAASSYILMEVGANVIIGRLYPGDWMLIPVDGTENIKASTSAAGMVYEFGFFHEG